MKKTIDMRFAVAQNKRLGLFGWIKAKIMTARMRRRWKNDAAYREHVQQAVNAGLAAKMKQSKKQ